MSKKIAYYSKSKVAVYVASRAAYPALDRYYKFAYFNLNKDNYVLHYWIPGAMNQHGEVIESELFIEDSHSPSRGFARFSDYTILGISGATAVLILAGVPILVVIIGIYYT